MTTSGFAGTTWNDPAKSTAEYPQGPLGDGIYLPQGGMQPGQPLGERRWRVWLLLQVAGSQAQGMDESAFLYSNAPGGVQLGQHSWATPSPSVAADSSLPAPQQPACGRTHVLETTSVVAVLATRLVAIYLFWFPAAEGMYTHATYWKGEFATGMMPQLKQYGNEDLLQTIR